MSAERAYVVEPAVAAHADAWLALRDALWPGSREDHVAEIETYFAERPRRAACFVARAADGEVVGFAEVGLRDYAEDCLTSPVGYLEGIYVAPEHRASGCGRGLVDAAEAWARSLGCTEMASDRDLANDASGAFHLAVGFAETTRIVCYRKSLA